MKTFREIFNIILTADKDASRKAAREVRKAVYSSGERDEYKVIKSVIDSAPSEYEKIKEDWRQENFVIAVSVMFFLHNRENQPDFLFPWLFQLLQHKNGNVRHAAVRMIEHELGSLTYHIRFPGEEHRFSKLKPEHADVILFGLQTNLNNLAASSWKLAYGKYIDDLPSGTYKSVQHILARLEDYSREAPTTMEVESKSEILKRKGEIEQELKEMLKKTEPTSPHPSRSASEGNARLRRGKEQFTLDDIKELIYNEEDNDDFDKLIAMFDRGGDASELSDVLELVTDAWNYFPHKVLGGISPAEKLAEYQSTKN